MLEGEMTLTDGTDGKEDRWSELVYRSQAWRHPRAG